jgi:DNA polymerase-1
VKRIALLDADIVAYKAACVSQTDIDWGGGVETHDEDIDKAINEAERLIVETEVDLEVDGSLICLTCPEANFRTHVYPDYKSNRKDVVPPRLLKQVKAHLALEHKAMVRPMLEADDIMGILATHPTQLNKLFGKGTTGIMVSIDKDMRTVPALYYNPDHPDRGIMDISVEDANRFHMWQTIVGDRVDGYPGCPGVAEGGKYVDGQFIEGARSFGYAHEVFEIDYEDLWDYVVWVYSTQGYREKDALVQARCAHILRAETYDFHKREPIMWTPDIL